MKPCKLKINLDTKHPDLKEKPVDFFKRSRASVAAPWIAVCGSRTGGRGGGSSVADSVSCGLIVVLVADPVSRWHWVRAVDQDRAGGSCWVLVGSGGR
ncbi:unnamed protein product [Pleuronectes platessa]|uniref:Uncharacterized protein n=1 Tax=Pleuronectes platessa TaxID=8262 RepID=A0A9N7TWQ0_PLEPL|nr:unnamed protein product [Pleuronectes platessa]